MDYRVIPRGQDRQVCSGYVRAESRWTIRVACVLLDGKEAGAILHPSYTFKIAGPMAKGRHQPAQESAKTVIVDEMLPFGTSEDARAETERLIRTLGKGGLYPRPLTRDSGGKTRTEHHGNVRCRVEALPSIGCPTSSLPRA